MIRRAKTLVRNHWKKVIFGGIAVQVASYGIRYAANRFISHQEDQAQLYWKKIKKQQHFENLEENCISTFRQLFQLMKITIADTLNAELIQEKLRNNEVENKLQAWEDLKLISFARVLTTIYGSSILYVLLRIQLSVVGGKIYVGTDSPSSIPPSSNAETPEKLDEETQRNYLDLANKFASSGVVKLCEYIYQKVNSVVAAMPLKQTMSASDIEQTLWAIIRKEVEVAETPDNNCQLDGHPCIYSWRYIFPDNLLKNEEYFRDSRIDIIGEMDNYKKLITETFDLLESDDTRDILRYFESSGVSHFVDRISESIRENYVSGTEEAEELLAVEPRVALAKLIPIMSSLHLVDVMDDPWVFLLTNCDSVSMFAANVYEAFSAESLL